MIPQYDRDGIKRLWFAAIKRAALDIERDRGWYADTARRWLATDAKIGLSLLGHQSEPIDQFLDRYDPGGNEHE